MQNLGDTVKTRRKERELTQEEVCNLAGVSRNFLKAVEANRTNIRLDLLLRVLELFGLTVTVSEIQNLKEGTE
ncbi:MAG: helix-turn-helix domain-containing protein [Bdellovibrionales bacterium]|nr:helix-turn-helix domain-containing protein [Bdellovibrionales bacterium]